jgi:three-Cys-motif partner protein
VLPGIQKKRYTRALCLFDPYKLNLDWQVILQAGQSAAVDLLLNFPVMDMNRNAIWRDPEKVPKTGIERMNRFWATNPGAALLMAKRGSIVCSAHQTSSNMAMTKSSPLSASG